MGFVHCNLVSTGLMHTLSHSADGASRLGNKITFLEFVEYQPESHRIILLISISDVRLKLPGSGRTGTAGLEGRNWLSGLVFLVFLPPYRTPSPIKERIS